MSIWLIILFIIFFSYVLTDLIRRYTLKKNIIDVPNNRSSHSIPTPRGGGISIVFTFLFAISFVDSLPQDIFFALIGAGILIAAVGFWDDQGHIAARWRLLSHFIAAFVVLIFLGGPPGFQVFDFNVDTGWLGIVTVAFILVWVLNLYNFMDGIDGIAAAETIFVACVGALFSWLSGFESLSFVSLILAASTMGFLFLNWPPAKIFMGDVGSAFLGLIIGIIAYASILKGLSVWLWVILLGVFLVDSGITLLRRILNGDKWYEAHCSHAYQHAARKWGHKRVTVATTMINLCWLLPMAYMVYLYEDYAALLFVTSYIPIVMLALKFKAGVAASS